MNQSEEWLQQLARGRSSEPPSASVAQDQLAMEIRKEFLTRVSQTTYATDPVLAHHLAINQPRGAETGGGKRA